MKSASVKSCHVLSEGVWLSLLPTNVKSFIPASCKVQYGIHLHLPVLQDVLGKGRLSYACPPHLCAPLLRPGLLRQILALVAIAVAGHMIAPRLRWLLWLLSICHAHIPVCSRLCTSMQIS